MRFGLDPGHVLGLTPEAATMLVLSVLASLTTSVLQIIAAVRSKGDTATTKDIQRQVTPPSNGQTLGALAETVQTAVAPHAVPPPELDEPEPVATT